MCRNHKRAARLAMLGPPGDYNPPTHLPALLRGLQLSAPLPCIMPAILCLNKAPLLTSKPIVVQHPMALGQPTDSMPLESISQPMAVYVPEEAAWKERVHADLNTYCAKRTNLAQCWCWLVSGATMACGLDPILKV